MINKATAILVIVAMGTTLLNFTFPYLWYYGNYEYVATELCIHQHRSDHECNGMCQLKLRIHKQSHHHDSSKQIVKREQQINLFTSDYFIFTTPLHSLYALVTEGGRFGSLWFSEASVPPPRLG